MAKQRKKKPAAIKPTLLKDGISKAQFDRGCVIVRKTIQFMGIEPALFDLIPKKQKQILLNIEAAAPTVRAKQGHFVPRQFVRNIHTELLKVIKNEYIDASTNLSYMEFFTYGIPFLSILEMWLDKGWLTPEQEEKFAKPLIQIFQKSIDIEKKSMAKVYSELDYQISRYSQINFRTYGFNSRWEVQIPHRKSITGSLRLVFELTAHENEHIYFTYQGKSRLAFRVLVGETCEHSLTYAILQREMLFPESKSNKYYNLYIQSHVIHRFKERIDLLEATERNHFIFSSMTWAQKVVKGANGSLMLVFSIASIPCGYFPFTIQGDKIFVLSFLPLVSAVTPEGAKLHEILKLGKEDLIYLGMDKLSFYLFVDFDQIPVLKEALIASGIWTIKEKLDEACIEFGGFDMKKTSFVKDFFLKLETRETALPAEYEEEELVQ
jgi:hypothetical protein